MITASAARCRISYSSSSLLRVSGRTLSSTANAREDQRLRDLGDEPQIRDEYAAVREKYETPKHPIVLAHGLLGFDELRLAGTPFPGIQYWRGIREAYAMKGIEVITATVPASGSIELRAARLGAIISEKAQGKSVNIIAGLDSRYMISRLKPPDVDVKSLTTIASPHRGSAFADYLMDQIGPAENLPKAYKTLEFFGLETGAFSQLTRRYMQETFNPKTLDREGVRYYSYGASLEPQYFSVFRYPHNVVKEMEGAMNDGLVSVPSSRWGVYKGTLMGVSHLDLINWTSRAKWLLYSMVGNRPNFNAIAFYLDIADMLAKEGL
ncbi:putative triacylglycerol lipase [Saccharata proteae CBS 121410]|uniref:Triacylglycerol lipase n=1 Tax=Saccharata proteae CBS 121410 TaxID=1314787 RepID=A0A9P4I0T8_9PEZI|nr:putative triacylglycerol lipase [Saccharata proteae CBS 121410]